MIHISLKEHPKEYSDKLKLRRVDHRNSQSRQVEVVERTAFGCGDNLLSELHSTSIGTQDTMLRYISDPM
jgi:hypothetical protein